MLSCLGRQLKAFIFQDLYEDGDDEMKRTIKKAWWEANENKKGGKGPMGL